MRLSDKPIIFSAPMVRALLEGRKTMTRRVVKLYPSVDGKRFCVYPPEAIIELGEGEFAKGICHYESTAALSGPYKLPYAVGDRLWVRENWRVHSWDEDCTFWIKYLADEAIIGHETRDEELCEKVCAELDRKGVEKDERGFYLSSAELRSRPSIHMPRWASRLTLKVTGVKVERLQDISEEDARAEGAPRLVHDGDGHFFQVAGGTHRCGFMGIWAHIHGDGLWEANPWIVAVTFTVIKQNIDAGRLALSQEEGSSK